MCLQIYSEEGVNLRKFRKQDLLDILLQNGIEHDSNMGRSQLLRLFNSRIYVNRLQILNEYWQLLQPGTGSDSSSLYFDEADRSFTQTETESDSSNLYIDASDHFSAGSLRASPVLDSTYHSSHSSLEVDLPDVSRYSRSSPAPTTGPQVGSQAMASDSSQASSSTRYGLLAPWPFYHQASYLRQPLFSEILSEVPDDGPLAISTKSKLPVATELFGSWICPPLTSDSRGFAAYKPRWRPDVAAFPNIFNPRLRFPKTILPPSSYDSSLGYTTRLRGPFDFDVASSNSFQTSSINTRNIAALQQLSCHLTAADFPRATDNRESSGYDNLPPAMKNFELPTSSLFRYFVRRIFREFIFFLLKNFVPALLALMVYGSMYMDMEIMRFISTEQPEIGLLLVPIVLFLSIATVTGLWRMYHGFIKRRARQRIIDAVVDRILNELKRKCALWKRGSFFHPHSSQPIRHFYNQFILAYPDKADLWEEVFNAIENNRDTMTVRRIEEGEEIDAWDYRPHVLNFM
ncbi:hypothetical protein G6F70_007430 [Rhizopus microsporus]|nr:hypothetical protein G6F71_007407 [Rhizopus microsporus]KAG1196470.1 hypothetical protein G6F70_007430 [Rhizopus microsporus]KAG1208208.1 hypothetical protein G6F69_007421 [Rhizopus microsporus]KAG1229475.1 hypothetical protein G6F67_007130 [Rhizopus microsporus]KAG1261386.1 hypothetical protein G6F68_006722 [Rhizopus microsporus]